MFRYSSELYSSQPCRSSQFSSSADADCREEEDGVEGAMSREGLDLRFIVVSPLVSECGNSPVWLRRYACLGKSRVRTLTQSFVEVRYTGDRRNMLPAHVWTLSYFTAPHLKMLAHGHQASHPQPDRCEVLRAVGCSSHM